DAFTALVREGKVRAISASNYSAERLGLALELGAMPGRARYECLQPHYNLCERKDFEDTLGPLCRSAGVGVIPYFSLARGFKILAALDDLAARLRTSPAAVALAWLMARPGITAPIASATTLEQLED